MKLATAQFWAETVNTLLGGHRVAVVNARACEGWEPDITTDRVEAAYAFAYTHAPAEGSFNIVSAHGSYTGSFTTIRVRPDTREIVMFAEHGAEGRAIWRVLCDLDEPAEDAWVRWEAAARAAWDLAPKEQL